MIMPICSLFVLGIACNKLFVEGILYSHFKFQNYIFGVFTRIRISLETQCIWLQVHGTGRHGTLSVGYFRSLTLDRICVSYKKEVVLQNNLRDSIFFSYTQLSCNSIFIFWYTYTSYDNRAKLALEICLLYLLNSAYY